MHDTAREEITRSNSAAVLNPLYQKAWLSMQWKSQEYHHHPIGPKCSCSIWEVSPSKLVTSSLVQYQMVPAEAGGTCSVIATIILLVIYSDWCLSQHDPKCIFGNPTPTQGSGKNNKNNWLYFQTSLANKFTCVPRRWQWLKLKSTGWNWSLWTLLFKTSSAGCLLQRKVALRALLALSMVLKRSP